MNIMDMNLLQGGNLNILQRRAEAQTFAASSPGKINKDSKLYKTAQEFEAIFIKQMLTTMKKTINKSGFINGGQAEEIFEDMLYDKYAYQMAQNANFGLADTIYNQLSAAARPEELINIKA